MLKINSLPKNPKDLHNCKKGTEVTLLYENGEEYTGIFQCIINSDEDDESVIISHPELGDAMIDIPMNWLKLYVERIV